MEREEEKPLERAIAFVSPHHSLFPLALQRAVRSPNSAPRRVRPHMLSGQPEHSRLENAAPEFMPARNFISDDRSARSPRRLLV